MNEIELRQARANALRAAKQLLDKTENEGRDFVPSEERQFNELLGEANYLAKKIGGNTPIAWTPDECREAYEGLDRSLGTIAGGKEPLGDYGANDIVSPEYRNAINLITDREYEGAFWRAIRNPGYVEPGDLRMLNRPEIRSLAFGSDVKGGYLLPESFEREIVKKIRENNVMRTLGQVLPLANDHNIPVETGYGSASWVTEGTEYPESDPSFGRIVLKAYKLGQIVKVSEELLADSGIDIQAYLADTLGRNLADGEEAAFVDGDGINKPTGFLTHAEVGKTTALSDNYTVDEVIELYHSLKRQYRSRATWVMNDLTALKLRQKKTGDGGYIWQPSLQAGEPDRLLGRPVVISSYMPIVAAGAKIIAFGDFRYYYIAERRGKFLQVLTEKYANTGHIGFRIYERVDGILALNEAVKVLQMHA